MKDCPFTFSQICSTYLAKAPTNTTTSTFLSNFLEAALALEMAKGTVPLLDYKMAGEEKAVTTALWRLISLREKVLHYQLFHFSQN
jgi:hypothetical protein